MEYLGSIIGVVGITSLMLVLVWPKKVPAPRHRKDPVLGDYNSITWRD